MVQFSNQLLDNSKAMAMNMDSLGLECPFSVPQSFALTSGLE